MPLDPVTQAKEYKKIADEVGKTSPITITKIQRVQNPSLYRIWYCIWYKRTKWNRKKEAMNEHFSMVQRKVAVLGLTRLVSTEAIVGRMVCSNLSSRNLRELVKLTIFLSRC